MNNLIFVPIGSREQHGPHLPSDTDYLIARRIVLELSRIFNGKQLKGLKIGISYEHEGFKSTRTIPPYKFRAKVEKIANKHAIDSIVVFVNAHGGNVAELKSMNILKGKNILLFNVPSVIKDDLARLRSSDLGGICHAGEYESSVALYLFPDLVRFSRLIKNNAVYVPEIDPNYKKQKLENWKTIEFSKSGVLGDPFHATRKKGKAWFKAIVLKISSEIQKVLT